MRTTKGVACKSDSSHFFLDVVISPETEILCSL